MLTADGSHSTLNIDRYITAFLISIVNNLRSPTYGHYIDVKYLTKIHNKCLLMRKL